MFLRLGPELHSRPGPRRCGGRSKALLGLAYLSLRLFGLPPTIAAWQQYHRHSRPRIGRGDRETVVREVDEAVRSGAAYHFLNTECKERALCCWSFLRGAGVPGPARVRNRSLPVCGSLLVRAGRPGAHGL